jgi:bifunctional non-homologous end joining protein LigD
MVVAMARDRTVVETASGDVSISNPAKVFFPALGLTKLDLVTYYLAVADGALRGVAERPMALKRYVDGAEGEFFFQKRAPKSRPEWVDVVTLRFPSGRSADEVVVRDARQLGWVVNLGCIDLNPHPVRADDLDHPDELRVDLDPVPGIAWPTITSVASVVRDTLADHGLIGWPKTSGSRGIHVYARIERRWTFTEVRRAAVALAREVERRAPDLATSRWWKEERHGVFIDYNQNAKDRTVASAYSVRPLKDARVSAPLLWEEVEGSDPSALTVATVPARFAAIGDPWEGIDDTAGSLDALLALADEQRAAGMDDAPWPPHYEKGTDEPPRVQPSRRRMTVPVVEIARAKTKDEALEGLERWKVRHAEVVPHLEPADVLVDAMRGRFTTWTRVRVRLSNVPADLRPRQEPLEVDYDPRVEWER